MSKYETYGRNVEVGKEEEEERKARSSGCNLLKNAMFINQHEVQVIVSKFLNFQVAQREVHSSSVLSKVVKGNLTKLGIFREKWMTQKLPILMPLSISESIVENRCVEFARMNLAINQHPRNSSRCYLPSSI